MSRATDNEDLAVLSALGGEDGWASVGYDSMGTTFAAVGGTRKKQWAGKPRKPVKGALGASRRARRKAAAKGFSSVQAFRKHRRQKIAKGVKKIANNKIVRAVSKAVLSVVPGGQAVVGISTAARMAAKGIKAVKSAAGKGDKRAAAALALGKAAQRGDRAALDTLREAASGRHGHLPAPASLMRGMLGAEGETFIVRSPSGREYRIDASTL